jgi:hypothetical protein
MTIFREKSSIIGYYRENRETLGFFQTEPFKFLEGFYPEEDEVARIREFCETNLWAINNYWINGYDMYIDDVLKTFKPIAPHYAKLVEMALQPADTGITFAKVWISKLRAPHGERVKVQKLNYKKGMEDGEVGYSLNPDGTLEKRYGDDSFLSKKEKEIIRKFYEDNKEIIEGLYWDQEPFSNMNQKQISQALIKVGTN